MNYSIEHLDVYRKAITAGTGLCRSAAEAAGNGSPALAEELRKRALAMTTHLADGLGFWENGIKTEHFSAAKRAVLEMLPILEVLKGMNLMKAEAQAVHSEDLRDMAKMISGLLRGAKRREKSSENPGPAAEEAGVERTVTH